MLKQKLIIGLGFQIGVGKDTVADALVQYHGFCKFKFADALKEAVCAIYGWRRCDLEDHTFKMKKDEFWKETPRTILQRFGTEAMRNVMQKDIWIKALERRIKLSPCEKIVISDVRFVNEIDAIKHWGGFVVLIKRSNCQSNMDTTTNFTHQSEIELLGYDSWDFQLMNNRTIDVLIHNTSLMLNRINQLWEKRKLI